MPPCGKTEGVLQIDKRRMRFALVQTCSRAALSVVCSGADLFACCPLGRLLGCRLVRVLPSRSFALVQTCSRAALSVVCSGADLFACCPLSHLLRKCQLSQRESQEGSLFEGAGLPLCGKTEGVFRIRFTLKRSCSRAAPSVTACAAPPSSGRKAFAARFHLQPTVELL